jgi:hypothetical protein
MNTFTPIFYKKSEVAFILKAAVEPLPVLDLLESTNTYSCWGFHPFGVLRSSC